MDKIRIKSLLHETFIREDEAQEPSEDNTGLYRRVQSVLDNELFNHSAIIKKLWGDKEASNRSLFRKKLYKEEDQEFTGDELKKILAIVAALIKQVGNGK